MCLVIVLWRFEASVNYSASCDLDRSEHNLRSNSWGRRNWSNCGFYRCDLILDSLKSLVRSRLSLQAGEEEPSAYLSISNVCPPMSSTEGKVRE